MSRRILLACVLTITIDLLTYPRRLVVGCQERCAGKAALGAVGAVCQVEEVARRGGDAPLEAGAQHGRLRRVHHQLAPFGARRRARVLGASTLGVLCQGLAQR